MRLLRLQLEQFRNYVAQTVEFSEEDIQLFVGKNGAGKTNILEALSILSLTKSCRGNEEQDLVLWDRTHYRIIAVICSDSGDESRIEVVSEIAPRRRKALFVNDVRTNAAMFVGTLPTVTFLPQDLLLFSGPPAERRRFFDELLSQVSAQYLEDLSQYQKILQQRNALLKRIAAGNEQSTALDVWDSELATRATAVTLARLELIEALNLSFLEEVRALGEEWATASLVYERKTTARTADALRSETIDLLLQHRERDIIMQSTSVGPHREDWQVYRDGRSIPSFASRGQERVAVLALLLLQVSYLQLRRGEKPVILLDDAFSELDEDHQLALLRAFAGHQVMMTATRVPENAQHARLHRVEEGVVLFSSPRGED